MRVVLQRVKKASVAIAEQTVGQINQGLMLLVGFQTGDGSEQIDHLVKKIANCRIFSDEEGKLNLNVQQIAGEIIRTMKCQNSHITHKLSPWHQYP